jgi:hypothetical protein
MESFSLEGCKVRAYGGRGVKEKAFFGLSDMKVSKFTFVMVMVAAAGVTGCSSDGNRAEDASTVPAMEDVPNPNPGGTASPGQQDQDSHGWTTGVQNASTGRQ